MSDNFEKDLAIAFQKASHKKTRVPRSANTKAIHVDEELSFYKNKLGHALRQGKDLEAERYTKKLIQLRARQLTLTLKRHSVHGVIDEEIKNKALQRYYADCYRLIRSVNILSS